MSSPSPSSNGGVPSTEQLSEMTLRVGCFLVSAASDCNDTAPTDASYRDGSSRGARPDELTFEKEAQRTMISAWKVKA